MTIKVIAGVLVFLFGGAIGISELVSRYRDAPLRALLTGPAFFYIALNAVASLAALILIRQFDWIDLDKKPEEVNVLLTQSLVAAFGAMAFFRTSLFNIRVGNTDIGVGPSGFLQVILTAADRACDRTRAKPRAKAVADIMAGISFEKSRQALPSLCFGLMQNVSADEQRSFGTIVKELEGSQMEQAFKANNLGLALMNVVGEGVLREAVGILRSAISEPPKAIVQSLQTLTLLKNFDFDRHSTDAVEGCLIVSGFFQDDQKKAAVLDNLKRVTDMTASPTDKKFYLSAVLISVFGENILQTVLKSLPP